MEDEKDQDLNSYVYVGFWVRVAVLIVDIICFLPVIFLYQFALSQSIETRNVLFLSLLYLLQYGLITMMVVKFGGTPGRLFLQTRIIDSSGNNLSVAKAILRLSLFLINTILFVVITQMAINNIPEEVLNIKQAKEFIKNYRNNSIWLSISGFIIFADVIFIVFNKKKRAIHDFISGSYVITKESFLRASKDKEVGG